MYFAGYDPQVYIVRTEGKANDLCTVALLGHGVISSSTPPSLEAVELQLGDSVNGQHCRSGRARRLYDQSGRQVASGIYFVQLDVNGLPPKLVRLYRRL